MRVASVVLGAIASVAFPVAASAAPQQNEQGGQGGGGAIDQANSDADRAGQQINQHVVGPKRQRQNEWEAQHPNADQRRDRNRQGNPSMQAPPPAAREAGQDTENAVTGVSRTVDEATAATDKAGPYRPFAIEYDPLGLFIGGRVSFNLEWVPVTHHAIEVSPHIVHTTSDVAISGSTTESQAFTGVGTEIGYRYYTGHRGANGVFVGPSLIVGAYNAGLPASNQAFTDVGVAADVGLQEIFWDHLVVGGGVGIEYLSVSTDFHDLPTGPSTIASSGIKPRFLLEAGYGF